VGKVYTAKINDKCKWKVCQAVVTLAHMAILLANISVMSNVCVTICQARMFSKHGCINVSTAYLLLFPASLFLLALLGETFLLLHALKDTLSLQQSCCRSRVVAGDWLVFSDMTCFYFDHLLIDYTSDSKIFIITRNLLNYH